MVPVRLRALQCMFDVFLGGTHAGSDAECLQTMRHYMPAKHRDFLEALTHQPSVREYIKQCKDRDLIAGYNGAVEALAHKTLTKATAYTGQMTR